MNDLFRAHSVLEAQGRRFKIARLAALIPRPRAHLVTYHGVFAPAAGARDRVVPEPPLDHLVEKNPRCPESDHPRPDPARPTALSP